MRNRYLPGIGLAALVIAAMTLFAGCSESAPKRLAPDIPRGYMSTLDIEINGRVLQFGPFAGYYFKPDSPDDLSRLSVLCFNEDFFYTGTCRKIRCCLKETRS